MTRFLLIRHGLTAAVNYKITGRLPGVPLNETGRQQAQDLVNRLSRFGIEAIYSSPLERALETAEPFAGRVGLTVQPLDALLEFDFGDWSGITLEELETRSDWKEFNQFRSSKRAPGGEIMSEVITRVISEIDRLSQSHRDKTLALFSHADTIKAALLHYLGMPIDHIGRLEVSPASVSVVHLHHWGVQVQSINMTF